MFPESRPMLAVISPAKKINPTPTTPAMGASLTTPVFADDAAHLVRAACALSKSQLQRLMGLSDALAALNHSRFQFFDDQPPGPAAFMFAGDTYVGLDVRSLSVSGLRHAQGCLRILSGLYGLLRPLDAIRPYRLEMGSRLATGRGKGLYAFWGDRIAKELDVQARATGAGYLLNCASKEYFGAVDPEALDLPVITPTFMEDKPDGPKVVSFHAKRARGALARFAMETRARTPQDLTAWCADGYSFMPDLSTPMAPVFVRKAAPLSSA